uniref:Protein kinase domain-containing protein n=1 Tax=Amphimedon queenslandica TaxID=400682 RepID=A0A1X7VAG0_AMPQE
MTLYISSAVSVDEHVKETAHFDVTFQPLTVDSLHFFLEEIISATDHFNKSREIKSVAMKGSEAMARGSSESQQIETELKALMKCQILSPKHFRNYGILFFIQALVSRYMENGSLYLWIHKTNAGYMQQWKLTWDCRISILKHVFRGVAYLHAGDKPIIHQDIKSLVAYLSTF